MRFYFAARAHTRLSENFAAIDTFYVHAKARVLFFAGVCAFETGLAYEALGIDRD